MEVVSWGFSVDFVTPEDEVERERRRRKMIGPFK